MIYQLPNGKVITLSVEQFLDMTDEDEQYLISINFGTYANNPFHGSVLTPGRREKDSDEDTIEVDTSIDFVSENDEVIGIVRIDINLIGDLPDTDTDFSDLTVEE